MTAEQLEKNEKKITKKILEPRYVDEHWKHAK